MSPLIVSRFWEKVNKEGPTPEHVPELGPCWVWTAAKREYGYGAVTVEGKAHKAHRFSWFMAFGQIPDGMQVLHRCDNPSCVRPEHLFLGTNSENRADMVAKGRGRGPRGEANGAYTHPERVRKGRAIHCARLDDDKVRQIRARRATGELQSDLAREFGVSENTISQIVMRRAWRHVG